MGSTVGQFVAVRMIVLKPGEDPAAFVSWMTGTFLNEMGKVFQGLGLKRITFLKGNKSARQSKDPAKNRGDSSAAGANADFAWITYWNGKQGNEKAWQENRTSAWDGLWKQFRGKCHPRGRGTPSRPKHGPPYDYLGGVPTSTQVHYGRGAGCLVEGFEVIYDETKWP